MSMQEDVHVQYVPVKQIVEVPQEKIVEREVVIPRQTERVVNVPEIIEVEKPYEVEQRVAARTYTNEEKPTVVAQRLRPIIHECENGHDVDTKTYEPVLYAVDVFVPKPVQGGIKIRGRGPTSHKVVAVPPPQYNSLLKKMNAELPPDAISELLVRGPSNDVPFLPVTELCEIVPLANGATLNRSPHVHHHYRQ